MARLDRYAFNQARKASKIAVTPRKAATSLLLPVRYTRSLGTSAISAYRVNLCAAFLAGSELAPRAIVSSVTSVFFVTEGRTASGHGKTESMTSFSATGD